MYRHAWTNGNVTVWQIDPSFPDPEYPHPRFRNAVGVSIEMKEQQDKSHCKYCGQLVVTDQCNFCGGPTDGNYERIGVGIATFTSFLPFGYFLLDLPKESGFHLVYRHTGRADVYYPDGVFLRMVDMKTVHRSIPDVVISDPSSIDSIRVEVVLEGQIQVTKEWSEI